MHIALHNYYSEYNRNNRAFDPSAYTIGSDLGYPLRHLRAELIAEGHTLHTADQLPLEHFDAFVFLDLPRKDDPVWRKACESRKPLYLVVLESEIVRPDNWDRDNHGPFERVFTWNPDYSDGQKYAHLPLTVKVPDDIRHVDFESKRPFVMMASKKRYRDPRELYSERLKAIRWFQANNPQDFDLYGVGWDRIPVPKVPVSIKNLVNKVVSPALKRRYPSYRGWVADKLATLENYRFSICYENARDLRGYITEKIFDCLFAGCLPVYWGAPEIGDLIPHQCFIDRRKYDDYESLYTDLMRMSAREYQTRMDAVSAYVRSDAIRSFSSENFARTLIDSLQKTHTYY